MSLKIKQIDGLSDLVQPDQTEVSSSPTALAATTQRVYVDTSSGNIELDLPAISGNDGLEYLIFQVAGANNILLDPNGTENIQGSASTLTVGGTVGDGIRVVCKATGSNTGWWLI